MRLAGELSKWIAMLASGLAVVGCATLASPAGRGAAAQPAEASGAATADTPERAPRAALPPQVSEALLPPIQIPLAEEQAVEEVRFDLAVNDVPATEFLMNLVQGTPYGIVVHPEIVGTISLSLKDVTIPEILDAVREVHGFEFQRIPNGFFALPPRLQSRVFQVDYPDIQRSGRSQMRVSSGQLSEQVGDAQGGASTGRQSRSVIDSSQVTTDGKLDFWEELASSLRAIVGVQEGRSVVVSPQAGIVVVRAMPAELRRAHKFVSLTRASSRRQVILEAKILEVALEDGFRAGINWALLIESGAKSLLVSQTGGGTLLGDAGVSDIVGNTGILDPDILGPVSNTDTSAFGGLLSLALDLDDFAAFIELLETQGRVRVLSNPRISTINNQKAVIKVGSDEFFVTDVSSTTVTGTATTTTPQVTLTPFFSGIALDVTPQISESGEVILHVHPSVSSVVDQTKAIEVAGEDLTLPLALSTIRESDSVVRARSGEIIAIGGLMQERSEDRRASTPWVAKIPYLGALFRQTSERSKTSELVILLRATVVGGETWAQELLRLERRLELAPYELEPGALWFDEERSPAP